MDFELSGEHKTIQQTAREFARREVAPKARAWDEEERFPKEIIPKLGELGFLGIRIPDEYGGSGLDTLAYAIIVEEIARADGSLALTVASHNGLGSSHLLSFGSARR
jgi:alkylation response protein AidB-like acyl-CoA dehydrogenase